MGVAVCSLNGWDTYIIIFNYCFSKVPKVIRAIAPKGSLEVQEEAWNCFPYIKTQITVEWVWFHYNYYNSYKIILESRLYERKFFHYY